MATSFLKCECLFRSGMWLKEIWELWVAVLEFAHFPSTLNWSKLFNASALPHTHSLSVSLLPLSRCLSELLDKLSHYFKSTFKEIYKNEWKEAEKNCWCYKFIFTLTVSLCICLMVKAYQTRTANCQESFFAARSLQCEYLCVCVFVIFSSFFYLHRLWQVPNWQVNSDKKEFRIGKAHTHAHTEPLIPNFICGFECHLRSISFICV